MLDGKEDHHQLQATEWRWRVELSLLESSIALPPRWAGMAEVHEFPGITECLICYGRVRRARQHEVDQAHRDMSPEDRAYLAGLPGACFICPRCGIDSLVKWQTWDLE